MSRNVKLNNQVSFDIFYDNSHIATLSSRWGGGGRCRDKNKNAAVIPGYGYKPWSYKTCLEVCQRTRQCTAITYSPAYGYCTLHRLVEYSNEAYDYEDGSSNYECYPLMEGIQIYVCEYFTTI